MPRCRWLPKAVEGTGGLDDTILSNFTSEAIFNTVMVHSGSARTGNGHAHVYRRFSSGA